ncbi:hypothetical protein JCM10213_005112 [Rhodosporidiobolus nylandii]
MPVPYLPLELISLILTELRLSCCEDDAIRRANGLSAALVCRSWKPLGVGVVWHRIKIEQSKEAERFLAHFDEYPQHACLVKEMVVEGCGDEVWAAEPLDECSKFIARLFRACPRVSTASLRSNGWFDAGRCVQHMAAHPAPFLQHFAVDITVLSFSLFTLFYHCSAFVDLRSLELRVLIVRPLVGSATPRRAPRLLPLAKLFMRLPFSTLEPFLVIDDLLSRVDPATLRAIDISLPTAGDVLWQRLASLPALRTLSFLTTAEPNPLPAFASLLPHLPSFQTLFRLVIVFHGDSTPPPAPSSQLTVRSFLDAIPLGLLVAVVGGLDLPLGNVESVDWSPMRHPGMCGVASMRITNDIESTSFYRVKMADGTSDWFRE